MARFASARRGRLLAACGGFALAALATLPAWQQTERARVAAEQARLGSVLADKLAAAAEDPLLRQDRVGLGVVANRMAARPLVRQAAILAADGQALALAGAAPGPDAAVFSAPVVLGDAMAAQAQVTMATDALATPATNLWTAIWPFWLAALAALTLAMLFGGGLLRGLGRTGGAADAAAPAEAEPVATGWVIAQLAAEGVSAPALEQALAALAAVTPRVARLYGAQAWPLPQGGLALEFAAEPVRDRHFNMVCAALLLRRALARSEAAADDGDAQPASGLFRYVVDDAPALTALAETPAGAIGDVVVGAAALAAMQDRERLRLGDSDPGAPAAVRGVAPDYETLLDAQAASITRRESSRRDSAIVSE